MIHPENALHILDIYFYNRPQKQHIEGSKNTTNKF